MKKRVLIVDDHPVICAAIRSVLDTNGYEVIGETADGIQALNLIKTLGPDYLILDIGIDSLDGISLLNRINSEAIDIKTLVFTSNLVSTYAARCLQAGAQGFINKSANLDELIKGLNAISGGYLYFPKEVLTQYRTFENKSGVALSQLTNKEIIVLQLLAKGFSNLEIADKLNLSNKTISGYKISLLKKLGVRSTVDLANIANEFGLH